jgi:hypothetical protein
MAPSMLLGAALVVAGLALRYGAPGLLISTGVFAMAAAAWASRKGGDDSHS